MELFGFEITRKTDKPQNQPESFVSPQKDDGAAVVVEGGTYHQVMDIEGSAKTEAELVNRYREMELHPEIDLAINDVINDSIVVDPQEPTVKINLEKIGIPPQVKKALENEFENTLKLLQFNSQAYDLFKRWYVDGRLYYHAIIDKANPGLGIQELRYVDPRKIKKIRHVKKIQTADPTAAQAVQVTKEYYMYNEQGFAPQQGLNRGGVTTIAGIRIAKDSIIQATSGLTDSSNQVILSHLHKAIKPLNQLRCIEDALVIMRLNRSVDRRVFYIDVGNLPKLKAEQYVREIMAKFKNRLVYDATTGEVKDERKFMTMLEDFWLPRRGGTSNGTQIDVLKGGDNLGETTDVEYFKQKLYRALSIPIGRMNSEGSFNFGKASEITREEIKFAKFIMRLRAKFALLFLKIMEKQVVLKGIMSIEDWDNIAQMITFDFNKDNEYAELKELEIMGLRLDVLARMEPFFGKFWSLNWIKKHILNQSEEQIMQIMKEIQTEMEQGFYDATMDPENTDKGGGITSKGSGDNSGAVPASGSTRYF